MIIDLRNDEDESIHSDLRVLRATTQNALFLYFKNKQIQTRSITEIHLGESMPNAEANATLAANIAKSFGCEVHFECRGTPGTAFPTTQKAAHSNYLSRRAAGERVAAAEEEEED